MNRAASLLVAVFAFGFARADADAIRVELRESGYFLGDLVEVRIELPLSIDERLDASSLPPPGRLNTWIELRDGHVESDGRHTRVHLTLQTFAAVEHVTALRVPDITLRAHGPRGPREVVVPGGRLVMSPMLPSELAETDRQLRKTAPPTPLPTIAHWLLAAASFLAAMAAATYLAWIHDRLPFLDRNPGPFTRLLRDLKHTARIDDKVLRRKVHEVLNSCAGETLFPATLHALFERSQHLAAIRPEIERFFVSSWNSFYGCGDPTDAEPIDAMSLIRIARDCERGLR